MVSCASLSGVNVLVASEERHLRILYGDVLAGRGSEDELVPFGGEQAHKAFALAVGLQLLVDALTPSAGFGAVLLVARPEADPVPAFRELAVAGLSDVPIMAVVARGEPITVTVKDGFDDVVEHPSEPGDLLARVIRLVRGGQGQ